MHVVRRATSVLAAAVMTFGCGSAVAQSGQLTVPPGAAPAPVPAPTPSSPPAPAATPDPAAPAAGASATAKPAPSAPSGLQPVKVGPVEITPARIVMRQAVNRNLVCLEPVVRLRATNIGTADLRLAIIGEGLTATDDLGIMVLQGLARQRVMPSVVGITRVDSLNDWTTASTTGSTRVTLLAPGQSVSVQLTRAAQPSSIHCRQDPSGDFRRSHRPTSVTLTATIGIIDISGNAELRTLSLFDIPVDVARN